ncbi:MAG: hypothetical protein K2Q25_15835, partial [Mycobacteriaceae bacterium]|nr:hypothetical protein [Mycobacteriaceae bacterium]
MPSSHSGSDLSWHSGDGFSDDGLAHNPQILDDNLSHHSGELFDSGRWLDPANPDESFNIEDSIKDNHFDDRNSLGPIVENKPKKNYKDPFQDPLRVLGLILLTLSGMAASLYFIKNTVSNKSEFLGSGEYDSSMLIDVCTDVSAFVTGIASAYIVNVGGRSQSGPIFAPAWYVHRAYIIVEFMEWTAGFGPPYEGDDLETGSQQFAAVSEQLLSAFPENGYWRGAAADAYADELAELRRYLNDAASYDRQLKQLVHNQAEWALAVRLILGLIKLLLCITAIYLTRAALIYLPNNLHLFGEASRKAMWIAQCAPAVGLLVVIILFSVSADKCKSINRLKDHYDAISPEDAEISAEPHIAAAQKTGVGGFDGIPSIAMLTNSAGYAGDAATAKQDRRFSGQLGDGDTASITPAPGAREGGRAGGR